MLFVLHNLFSKDALNRSKVTVKILIMLQKKSNKRCSFELSIHYIILNNITVSMKILSSTTVFNIDKNKKCFLSTKSAY